LNPQFWAFLSRQFPLSPLSAGNAATAQARRISAQSGIFRPIFWMIKKGQKKTRQSTKNKE
jgi:hypothetical protein